MKTKRSNCARCPYEMALRICRNETGKAPKNCPTIAKPDLIKQTLAEFEQPDIESFARLASIQEGEGYAGRELGYASVRPIKPRILEIIEFAHKMNYACLGLAFCAGLAQEAKIVEKLLSHKGFEVVSVICFKIEIELNYF
jgi:uncharacterized metal-binding protein